MRHITFKTNLLLLLAFLTAGSQVLAPVLASADDTRPFCLSETEMDSDEAEDSSESTLGTTVVTAIVWFEESGFHAVSDEVNHQMDWLFIHEHSARAPPKG